MTTLTRRLRRYTLGLAPHGWLGLLLIAVFWPLNWGLELTHVLFFPLWLGYILTVDAVVARRRGTSLFERAPRGFVLLFICSAPAWWLFEVINWRTQNWEYLGVDHLSDLTYFIFSSIAFSTVMPAVFETAEGVRSFDWVKRLKRGPRLKPTPTVLRAMMGTGLLMLALLLIWPTYFYPFVWGSAYLITEPINAWRGNRTLLDYTRQGDWRPVVALSLGALICGFFWEMWNVYAYPKWIYHTPGVEFWYIFEMPLIGYIGYLPFAFELYALLHFLLPNPPQLRL